MNGPDHYREAERLAVRAHHFTYGDGGDPATGAALAAEALVHATLALAAATALSVPARSAPARATNREHLAWQAAAGIPDPTAAPAAEEDVQADITVYRASNESIVCGWYTTPEAARAHCVTLLRRDSPDSVLNWVEDEEDDVAELFATSSDGEEAATGYVVWGVTVEAAYDAEADE
ncbi:hypothetical protein ACFVDH_22075 [Streptomyces sp. NPDC057674]|uniref:hypothetical protein n=1 Tax=Streptomyces sp. NPDC057674 TaxID=3346203 RepID=UPI00369CF21F